MPAERGSENLKNFIPNLTSLHGLCENTLQQLVRESGGILSYRVRCPTIAIPIRHLLDLFGEQCSLLTFPLFFTSKHLFSSGHIDDLCVAYEQSARYLHRLVEESTKSDLSEVRSESFRTRLQVVRRPISCARRLLSDWRKGRRVLRSSATGRVT